MNRPGRRIADHRERGFTLIELLVAVALGLAILIIASDLLISSSRTATDLQGRNELIQESQIAQNYLISQLREAVYVFPVGTTLNLGSGATTKRPGGGAWVVGDPRVPIVGIVRPPRALGRVCYDAARASRYDDDACYQFLAYYPVLRSDWLSGVTGQNDPGPDAPNDRRWVLVEYRSNYQAPPPPVSLTVSSYDPTPSPVSARLLLDYVQPTTLALPGTPPLFQVNNLSDSGAWVQQPGDISVTVNLTVSRRLGRRDITVPTRSADTTPLNSVTTVVAAPRNLGTLRP